MLNVEESGHATTVCPLCDQQYTDPRTLPCMHTFCLLCLQKLDVSYMDQSTSCPVCDDKFAGPVTDLPRNSFIEKLIKINRVANGAVTQMTPCDVCQQGSGSAITLATHHCFNCAESLCDNCYTMHGRIKSSRHHRVVKLGAKLSDQDFRGPIPHCNQHVDEPLKMFCTDCARCICFLCYAEYHTGHHCQDVNKVADKFISDLNRIVERATAVLAEEFGRTELLSNQRDQFVAQLHQCETAVQHKAAKLKFVVDLHANELLDTLGDTRDVGLKRFERAKSRMEKCNKLTEDFRQYALEVRNKGTASDVIDAVSDLEARVSELERRHADHLGNTHLFDDVTFMSFDLQQVLGAEKISNMVGRIDCSSADAHNQVGKSATQESKVINAGKGQKSFTISAKASLVVRDCTDDGKCLTIENTGTKTQCLGGWTLTRNIDGEDLIRYCLPQELKIFPRTKIKLWCLGCTPSGDSATDIETTQKTWGIGSNIITRLLNQSGEEFAAHRQRTTYP